MKLPMHCSVYAVKKDDRLRHIGEEDRFDDETVFIIKRSWPKASHNRVADVRTTLKVYAHLIPQSQRDSTERIAKRSIGTNVPIGTYVPIGIDVVT